MRTRIENEPDNGSEEHPTGGVTAPKTAPPSSLPPVNSAGKRRTINYLKRFSGISFGGSSEQMDSSTVQANTGDVIKPAIKYRMDDNNTLEIHLYIATVTYHSADAAPTDRDQNSTLARQYREGVESYWSIALSSKRYKFKTKVVWHEGSAASLKAATQEGGAQQYIAVCIGGVCPAYAPKSCPESADGNHWYHAHPMGPIGYPGYPSNIYLPLVAQTKANTTPQKRTNLTGKKFSAACAHETGHILGLADAYPAPDAHKVVDRMNENAQTCQKNRGQYCNLMKDQNSVRQALPNDVIMVLQAYSTQLQNYGKDFVQNYKTYDWADSSSNTKNPVSPVITNRKDLQHD